MRSALKARPDIIGHSFYLMLTLSTMYIVLCQYCASLKTGKENQQSFFPILVISKYLPTSLICILVRFIFIEDKSKYILCQHRRKGNFLLQISVLSKKNKKLKNFYSDRLGEIPILNRKLLQFALTMQNVHIYNETQTILKASFVKIFSASDLR